MAIERGRGSNAAMIRAATSQPSAPGAPLSLAPRIEPRTPRARRLIWVSAGALSAAYIAIVAIRPDAIAAWTVRASEEARSTTELSRLAHQTARGVASVERTVAGLGADVGALKAGLAAFDERERQLIERLGAVETRVERFATQALAPSPTNLRPAAAGRATPPDAPARKPAEPPRNLETASIAPSLAPAPQPVTATASGPAPGALVGVLIASGPSLDAVRLTWSLLNERHKSLKALEPRVISSEGGSVQLVAGPLPNDGEAAKVCAALRQRGATCRTAEFKGEAL
jgi:cell division septation protein DedD